METPSDETIRSYLLGQLPESETERLDELSITDDECAERIRAVEHDLVDAFVRGELEDVVLEQVRATYLTTPRRRESIRFARALQSLDEGVDSGDAPAAGRRMSTPGRARRRWPLWLAMAAGVALATTSLWLALDNRALRTRVTSDELRHDRQLREAQALVADATRRPEAGPTPQLRTVATLVLTPQLRSGRQLPTLALNSDTGDVAVQLDLEPVDYPSYTATLVASGDDRVLWRSDRLIARTTSDRQRLDIVLPAAVLNPRSYVIRVSGVSVAGASEIVGEYTFTVVR
jgi:hypothetical protein